MVKEINEVSYGKALPGVFPHPLPAREKILSHDGLEPIDMCC